MADIYVATDSGSAEVDGQLYTFVKGQTRVTADHPLARSGLFAPVTENLHVHGVEQATAAPGEKRGGRARGKKADADAEAEADPESDDA